MPGSLQIQDVKAAIPYWLEQIPVTLLQSTLAPNSKQNVFTLRGWNAQQNLSTLVELTEIGATQHANLRYDLTYDRGSTYGFTDGFPAALRPRTMRHGAVSNMSLDLTNTSSALTLQNVQVNYLATVWRMSVAHKVEHGIGLTPDEQAAAKRIGVSLSAVDQKGVFPFPIETIVERTYRNRLLREEVVTLHPTASTQETVFHPMSAGPNELLVLRRIAAEGTIAEGVVINVDRDNDADHVSVYASSLDLERGVDCLVPAKSTMNLKIVSAVTPAYLTPIFVTVWHVALSNILRVRLGELTLQGLQSLYGEKLGQTLYDDVLTGVN